MNPLKRLFLQYKKSKTTAKAGVIHVEGIVNSQGSVFRPVHQEDDFGIDGFIELVNSETVLGRLIGVQIKAGDSYLSKGKDQFEVQVDDRHLDYWYNFMVPVILICYSPSKNLAAWVSVRDYIEYEKYFDRPPISKIFIPFRNLFNEEALAKNIAGLAQVRLDERTLLKCADMCLSLNPAVRQQGFQILSQHPDSRDLKVTCLFARKLLLDENIETAKDALFMLGYGVRRDRWSWNPNNEDEKEIISYTSKLCSDLNEREIYRIVELIEGEEEFYGPQGLGEKCFDVLSCCFAKAQEVLDSIASDKSLTMQRRADALFLLYKCDDSLIDKAEEELLENPKLREVLLWMNKRLRLMNKKNT